MNRFRRPFRLVPVVILLALLVAPVASSPPIPQRRKRSFFLRVSQNTALPMACASFSIRIPRRPALRST